MAESLLAMALTPAGNSSPGDHHDATTDKQRAIASGVSLCTVLDAVRTFRETDTDTPVVLMGYLNPIERYGYESFADDASAAGVDGILLVDCPPEEDRKSVV